MSHSLQQSLESFLAAPDATAFSQVRRQLVGDKQFAPNPRTLQRLESLLEAEQHETLLQAAEDLMPAWSLSPRVHQLCTVAAVELGDVEQAELFGFLAEACLTGLLTTGDGTRRRPYLCTYPGDQKAVLASFLVTAKSRRIVEAAGCLLECVVTCEQKTIWFDVTELLQVPTRNVSVATASGQ